MDVLKKGLGSLPVIAEFPRRLDIAGIIAHAALLQADAQAGVGTVGLVAGHRSAGTPHPP